LRDDPSVVGLVERARAGDKAAWDGIVERYAPLVWSVCRRYGLSTADAEDVGSSVWLRLIEKLDTIKEPAALPGWLATTTQRACFHHFRANERQIPVGDIDLDADESAPGPDGWLLKEERHIALRDAFVELSGRCRQLLTMLFGEPAVPYARISSSLDMPVGAIGPTRRRCLQRLREMPSLAALLDPPATAGKGLPG
jgi:RNA polymerase sigma factor (sigma-70 family)